MASSATTVLPLPTSPWSSLGHGREGVTAERQGKLERGVERGCSVETDTQRRVRPGAPLVTTVPPLPAQLVDVVECRLSCVADAVRDVGK